MDKVIVEKSVKALAGTIFSSSSDYQKTVDSLFGKGCEVVKTDGKNMNKLDVYRKSRFCVMIDDHSAGAPVIYANEDFFDKTITKWKIGFFREFRADKQMFSVLDRNMQEQVVDIVLPLGKYRSFVDTQNLPTSAVETLYD